MQQYRTPKHIQICDWLRQKGHNYREWESTTSIDEYAKSAFWALCIYRAGMCAGAAGALLPRIKADIAVPVVMAVAAARLAWAHVVRLTLDYRRPALGVSPRINLTIVVLVMLGCYYFRPIHVPVYAAVTAVLVHSVRYLWHRSATAYVAWQGQRERRAPQRVLA